jgi:3-oxoacyl-(acyl-carrier-protein) synthase
MIAIDHQIKGPCFSVASACASGSDGIGTALLMLKAGMIDAAGGAAEMTVCSTGVVAFDRVGAMSRRNDDSPSPQPFDKPTGGDGWRGDYSGADRAERGQTPWRNLPATAPRPMPTTSPPARNREGGAAAMRMALETAGANADELGYINAHGTGTQLNDQSETRAIRAAFGDLAYKIPISSTKSMTGHMMGATGALEVIFCVKAMREGVLPPTIHYETPDPECDLDYIPNQAREKKINLAISNAFGFGGHNAVLSIRRY